MPLQMRLPKRGFKNINRVEYIAMNVARLQEIFENYGLKEISNKSLYEAGIIQKNDLVKILGNGEISAALNVQVANFSATAKTKIEAAGGSITSN
jgi:large subunit ribosomal protein L15